MPTIDIPDKICSHCGGTLWYNSNTRPTLICILYKREQEKKLRTNNIESYRETRKKNYHSKLDKTSYYEYNKKYRLKHPDKVIGWYAKYNSSEKFRLTIKRNKKNQKIDLQNCYVKWLLTKNNDLLFAKDINLELVDLKRKQLLLKRKSKQNG